jgi:formylmethanofuran dehydrogenase subunit E
MGILLSGTAFDVQKYRALIVFEDMHRVNSATCYYCGKMISVEEAVVRDDIMMCRECAESHPSTANVKKK